MRVFSNGRTALSILRIHRHNACYGAVPALPTCIMLNSRNYLNRVEHLMVWVIVHDLLPSLFFTARQAAYKFLVCFWRCSISPPHLMILGGGNTGQDLGGSVKLTF